MKFACELGKMYFVIGTYGERIGYKLYIIIERGQLTIYYLLKKIYFLVLAKVRWICYYYYCYYSKFIDQYFSRYFFRFRVLRFTNPSLFSLFSFICSSAIFAFSLFLSLQFCCCHYSISSYLSILCMMLIVYKIALSCLTHFFFLLLDSIKVSQQNNFHFNLARFFSPLLFN